MLIVYLEPFQESQIQLLTSWKDLVHYWPRSFAHTDAYNAAIPTDYWLLFSQHMLALQWLMMYPEYSRVQRELWD